MSNSWIGTRVRKGERYGTVITDSNYYLRILTVKMDDGGSFEKIVMNNVHDDPPETKEWEWFWEKTDDKKWYRF